MSNPQPARRWLCLWWPEARAALLVPRRKEDYPAAHSMDTQWFAVDVDGHVAYAETGESGCAPADADRELWIYDVLAQIRGVLSNEEFIDQMNRNLREEATNSGLFVYELLLDYTTFESPYRLAVAPAKPLHVDQLPPPLRDQFKRFRLDNVRFPETPLLQLIEHVSCDIWGSGTVYLASDGVTLRAVPGHETEFDAAIQTILGYDPDLLTRYKVERPGNDHNAKGV
jgi:hypothetical protein